MPLSIPYLTFKGNCREAMIFYQSCLGGELSLQTIGESPLAERLPRSMQDHILHAALRRDSFMIMGTDMVGERGLIEGNSFSILLECESEQEFRRLFRRLSSGGRQDFPAEKTYWGALFAGLADKFGREWLLHFNG